MDARLGVSVCWARCKRRTPWKEVWGEREEPQVPPLITPFSTSAARSSLARVMTLARSVAAAWLALARWAVGFAPWKPILAPGLQWGRV